MVNLMEDPKILMQRGGGSGLAPERLSLNIRNDTTPELLDTVNGI